MYIYLKENFKSPTFVYDFFFKKENGLLHVKNCGACPEFELGAKSGHRWTWTPLAEALCLCLCFGHPNL